MKFTSFLFLTIFMLTSCSKEIDILPPDDQPDITYQDHPKHVVYQQAIESYRSSTLSPGSVLLIHRTDEAHWIGATGKSNLKYNTPMRTTTQFRTGSVTKMFTAVVILKLFEQGKISLEDNLAFRLPEVNGKIPQSDKITVRHLLGHLSGIIDPPNESLRYKSDLINDPQRIRNMTTDELLKKYVYGDDLHFSPGSNYAYSNTNYWLLGKIIEQLTGKSLQAAMEETIFTPLHMTHTYIERRDDRNVARGYSDLYGNGVLMDVSTWDSAEGNGKADGGLISTAEDLHTFMYALFKGSLLKSETLNEMKKVQLASCQSPDCEYGLGLEIWRVKSGIAYGHNGALAGIEANALYYENSNAITILYRNSGGGSAKGWLDDLLE